MCKRCIMLQHRHTQINCANKLCRIDVVGLDYLPNTFLIERNRKCISHHITSKIKVEVFDVNVAVCRESEKKERIICEKSEMNK